MPLTTIALGPVQLAEAERVEQRNRPRAHGEDVAQDATDAGRRALVRLHGRGVIVRFDLERQCEPLPDIDHSCVLARPLKHPGRLRGELAQQRPRVLVAAVLRPHGAEDAQLGVGRLAIENAEDQLVFLRRETVLLDQLLGDRRVAVAGTH
jgi:hypothetical protein